MQRPDAHSVRDLGNVILVCVNHVAGRWLKSAKLKIAFFAAVAARRVEGARSHGSVHNSMPEMRRAQMCAGHIGC